MPPSAGDAAGAADPATDAPPPLAHRFEGLPSPGNNVRVVDLDVRSVLVAIVTMVAIVVIATIAASGIVATVLVLAGLFAFALDPVVDALQARLSLRRGYAVALMVATAAIAVGVGIAVLGPQTVDQARSFQTELPKVLESLNDLPLVGGTLKENDVPAKIQQWAAKLPKQLSGDPSQITNTAERIITVLIDSLAVMFMMIALLLDGPWLVSGVQRLIPPNRRETSQRLGVILSQVIGKYFAGSLLLATLQGLQVLITGILLQVPLSPLLAVWAAVWNLVPQVGGAIGGIVFVLVAFTQGATTGVIAAIVFLLYITFANNVLLPIILGRAVNISPLATMVATIGGFAVFGIVGAMLAVPILGAGKAMFLEMRKIQQEEEEEPPPKKPGVVRKTVNRLRTSKRAPVPLPG